MSHLTCNLCSEPVALGDAVLRSRNFERVAWHPACYDVDHADRVIPEQRKPEHDRLVDAKMSA